LPRIFPILSLLFAASALAESTTAPFEEPRGELTLRQAMAAALLNSPQLALYPWDLRIAEARLTQAGLRPNPEFSVEVENIGLGGDGETTATTRTLGLGPDGIFGDYEHETEGGSDSFSEAEVTLSLSHTLELGGKRAARMAAAERERDVASWDYEVARAEVAGEVLVRFTEVLAIQARLGQQKSLVDLSEQFAANVRGMVEAGSVSPLEARRAEAEVERARVQHQDLVRAADLARGHLAELWGSSQAQFTEASGDVIATEPLPALQSLLDEREAHPMLKRWGAELARRDALLLVERKQRVPDLTVRVGYRGTSGDAPSARGLSAGNDGIAGSRTSLDGDGWENSVVLEASIPLPLFHRNQGAIAEAELMVGRLSDEQRAWEKSLESALAARHRSASAALEKIDGLKAHVLPELEATLALTREGYELGKFDFLRVLDAQRAVFEVRSEILDAQVDYHLSRADLEQLTGAAILAADNSHGVGMPETNKENDHE
jgi:cobalt-zinc-cadmium efflux system outer membrane protein